MGYWVFSLGRLQSRSVVPVVENILCQVVWKTTSYASGTEYYTFYLYFDTHIDSSLIWSIFYMVTSDMKCVGDPKNIAAT